MQRGGEYEKRKGIIFSTANTKRLIKWPLIGELSRQKESLWEESINLLANGLLSDMNGSIAFFVIGEINNSVLNEIDQSFKKYIINREIKLTNDFREAIKYSNLVVMTALGITKKHEIIESNKKILLQKKTVEGLIVLDGCDLKI